LAFGSREVLRLDARLAQHITDGLYREACPILDAAETFFFRRRDQLTILNQTGGCPAVISIDTENIQNALPLSSGCKTARIMTQLEHNL
jgi:hypothetical protein